MLLRESKRDGEVVNTFQSVETLAQLDRVLTRRAESCEQISR